MKKKDPTSHRIIEKRRRDRMNNCLADLSKLIPVHYMKKGRGRIEKTEIIEMAIKHLKDLMELSKAHQKQQQQQQVVQNVQQQQTQNDISDQMTSNESKFPTCLSSSTSSMSPFAPRPSSERFDGTALMLMNQDDLQTTKNNPITIDNRGAQLHLRRQTTTGYLGVDPIATAQAGSTQMNGFISAQDVQHLANVNKTTSKEIKIEPSSLASSTNTSVANLGTVAAAPGSTTSTAEAVSAMINGTLSPASSSATKSYYNHYHASSNHHHHHHHHHHGNSGNSTTSTSISNNDGTTSSNASGNHHHNHKYRSSANLSSSTSSGSDSSGSSSSLGSSYGAGGGGNKSSNGESSSGHRSAGSSSSMRTSCSSSSVTAMNTGINMSGLVVDRGTTTSLHNITGNIDNNHNNSGLKSISSDPMVAGSAKQSTLLYPTGAGSLPQPGPVPMIITATNSLNHNGPLECCACGARIITLNHANNNSGSNSDSSISSNDNLSISPNNQSDTNSMDYSCKTSNVKREAGNNLTSELARSRLNGQSNGDTSSLSSSMSSSNSNSPPSSSSSSSSSSAWYKKAWLVRSFSRSPAMR